MGKRSNFERLPRDEYDTQASAVAPLLALLPPRTKFVEPCAGNGCLIEHLERAGHECVARYGMPDDARVKRYAEVELGDVIFATNSPWDRSLLHPIIVNLSDQA